MQLSSKSTRCLSSRCINCHLVHAMLVNEFIEHGEERVQEPHHLSWSYTLWVDYCQGVCAWMCVYQQAVCFCVNN